MPIRKPAHARTSKYIHTDAHSVESVRERGRERERANVEQCRRRESKSSIIPTGVCDSDA